MTQFDSPAVKLWFESAGHLEEPQEVQDRLLGILQGFLEHTGKTPDDLVAGCFLRKKGTGDKFVSVKARTEMNDSINEYVAKQGWIGRDALANGNVVRSFLIHNGVFIQGGAWRGSATDNEE